MNIKEKKQRLKEILSGSETLQKALVMNNFEEVYNRLPQYLIPVFTDVCLDARINSLNFMKEVPNFFMRGLEGVINVEIPQGITRINPFSFSDMDQLQSVTIPSSVKTINYSAFEDDYKLYNVDLSEGLEEIGSNAFAHCTTLESITLPSTLKKVYPDAFAESGLKEIKYLGNQEQFDKIKGDLLAFLPNVKVEILGE